jgi:lipopolysaccharide/colanic/teichoic acid biosynthesis glycosyltransferase
MNRNPRGLAYCRGKFKRIVDIVVSGLALLFLSPIIAVLTLLQLLADGRPVLFVQQRVGFRGSLFNLLKFRTMRVDQSGGAHITARDDMRITAMGRVLRASKLDELPQLVNVFIGEMSIVGPRPELPDYVKLYSENQRRVLEARPGLTDPATLRFRDEERLLAGIEAKERERYYIHEVMPKKLELNLTYLERASLPFDMLLIVRTMSAIVFPRET